MKTLRAFRGATQLTADDSLEMRGAVVELLEEILHANQIANEDLISILFTATSDLKSEFPAVGVRMYGINDVPLICAQEIEVVNALPRVIRILIHAQSKLSRAEIAHKYLRGAQVLRPDLEEVSAPKDGELN
ncbi:MAG: chorismate mutase [Candidatus Nanopelagicaceae bacterium]